MEYFFILITDPKYISPILISLIGGGLRILQRSYAKDMCNFFLRILSILIVGNAVYFIFDNNIEIIGFLSGYFIVDVVDISCNFFRKK